MRIEQFLRDLSLRAKAKVIEGGKGREVHMWRIISALRGPDLPPGKSDTVNIDQLKWFTTARIRHIVFGHFDMNDENNNDILGLDVNPVPLNNELRKERNSLLNEFSPHFRAHIHNAYSSIRELYNYDLEIEHGW